MHDFFFFQAEDGIRDHCVTGVQTCALPISPRWTYGALSSGSPLGPIVPTPSPSATVAPFVTAIEPRCTSVTDQPSGVSIVTVLPADGTVPAKVTTPDAGACTVAPASPATSIPRCCPAA